MPSRLNYYTFRTSPDVWLSICPSLVSSSQVFYPLLFHIKISSFLHNPFGILVEIAWPMNLRRTDVITICGLSLRWFASSLASLNKALSFSLDRCCTSFVKFISYFIFSLTNITVFLNDTPVSYTVRMQPPNYTLVHVCQSFWGRWQWKRDQASGGPPLLILPHLGGPPCPHPGQNHHTQATSEQHPTLLPSRVGVVPTVPFGIALAVGSVVFPVQRFAKNENRTLVNFAVNVEKVYGQ